MANFNQAFKCTLKFEGGYSDHPLDRGGKTKYGITEKVARAEGWMGSMNDLPLVIAKKIYERNYWNKLNLNNIDEQYIATELFDTAVNCGVRTSGKFFQKAINLISAYYVTVDGIIGDKTIDIYNRLNTWEKKIMLKCLNGLQFEYYHNIVRRLNPKMKIFFKGWLKRV